MSESDLLTLDPSIRDWVVLPMLLIVILVGMGRHYVQELVKSPQVYMEADLKEMRCKQILQQSSRLRQHGKTVNPRSAAYTIDTPDESDRLCSVFKRMLSKLQIVSSS